MGRSMATNVKETIDQLIELQEADLAMKRAAADLNRGPARLTALDLRIEELEKGAREATEELDILRKTYRELEQEQKESLEAEEKGRDRLRAVKTNKEYAALLRETEQIAKKRSSVETGILETLERIETAEAAVKNAEEAVASQKQELLDERASLEKELAAARALVEERKAAFETMKESVPMKVRKVVERIRQSTGGTFIVPATREVCKGCHLNMPPQLFNEMQRYEEMKSCPHCERIIYHLPE